MAEPTVGDDREGAPRRIERHAHTLWIASERGESGRLRADSRAFSSLPVSLARDTPSSREATIPGELLAAAQSVSFAVTLADLLAHDGSPAHELAVDTTCELREEPSGTRQITALRPAPLRSSTRTRPQQLPGARRGGTGELPGFSRPQRRHPDPHRCPASRGALMPALDDARATTPDAPHQAGSLKAADRILEITRRSDH